MRPFIKWVGGKHRAMKTLFPVLTAAAPPGRYVEPFLGGGAAFLVLRTDGYLEPSQPFLGDMNHRLIWTWQAVRDSPLQVIEWLQTFEAEDSAELFADLRLRFNTQAEEMEPAMLAAIFIYLNRACYNGLYRENKKGHFNASFAGENARTLGKNILFEDRILGASKALQGADIQCRDFERTIQTAESGDLVYADSPYHKTSQQTYVAGDFTDEDQQRLAQALTAAAGRGAAVVASNADTEFVRELYRDFHIFESSRVNTINTDITGRASKRDLVITSFI